MNEKEMELLQEMIQRFERAVEEFGNFVADFEAAMRVRKKS